MLRASAATPSTPTSCAGSAGRFGQVARTSLAGPKGGQLCHPPAPLQVGEWQGCHHHRRWGGVVRPHAIPCPGLDSPGSGVKGFTVRSLRRAQSRRPSGACRTFVAWWAMSELAAPPVPLRADPHDSRGRASQGAWLIPSRKCPRAGLAQSNPQTPLRRLGSNSRDLRLVAKSPSTEMRVVSRCRCPGWIRPAGALSVGAP